MCVYDIFSYIFVFLCMCKYVCISLVESQKGVNAGQRCSIENQKGAVAVQSLW